MRSKCVSSERTYCVLIMCFEVVIDIWYWTLIINYYYVCVHQAPPCKPPDARNFRGRGVWDTLPISYSVAPPTAHSVGLERHWQLGKGMKSDRGKWRTSADGPDCEAACPNFVHLYILVVNKSLSVEVPYTGRFWLHNATEQTNVIAQMSETTSWTTMAYSDTSIHDSDKSCLWLDLKYSHISIKPEFFYFYDRLPMPQF